MNWYSNILLKSAGLEAMLQSLGVSDDIYQFILSLPDSEKGLYVNEIRKNPQMNLDQLQQTVQQVQSQQVDPYYPHEYKIAEQFPPQARKWILVQLKEGRDSNLNASYQELTSLQYDAHDNFPKYLETWNKIDYWIRTHGLTDFLRFNPNYRLEGKDIWDVDEDIMEWHAIQQGRGQGLMYGQKDENLIAYGPQWQNPEWDGWTIQEIKTSNDLKAEGNKMNHCVGSYCTEVEEGKVRIFSLRDPQNEPHVTIETDDDMSEFVQIQGNSNSEPKDQYKAMIREWVTSAGINAYAPEENAIEDPEDFDQWERYLEKLPQWHHGGPVDDYGLKVDIDYEKKWHDILYDMIQRANYENRRSREKTFTGDVVNMTDKLLAAAEQVGPASLYELLTAASKLEQEGYEEIMNNWFYEPYEPYPEEPFEDEYETEDEYKQALEDYHEKIEELQRMEDDAMDEVANQWVETGLPRDIWNTYNSLVSAGRLPKWEELEKAAKQQEAKAAMNIYNNWYKRAEKHTKIRNVPKNINQKLWDMFGVDLNTGEVLTIPSKSKKKRNGECSSSLDMHCDGEDDGW